MSELQTSLPALLESPRGHSAARLHTPATLQLCLVVSASPRRAQLLAQAAHEENWATVVCNSADDALRQTVRQRVQLALIDLQSAPAEHLKSIKQLVEQL